MLVPVAPEVRRHRRHQPGKLHQAAAPPRLEWRHRSSCCHHRRRLAEMKWFQKEYPGQCSQCVVELNEKERANPIASTTSTRRHLSVARAGMPQQAIAATHIHERTWYRRWDLCFRSLPISCCMCLACTSWSFWSRCRHRCCWLYLSSAD